MIPRQYFRSGSGSRKAKLIPKKRKLNKKIRFRRIKGLKTYFWNLEIRR
jgi:hypothetical protein